ncbi:MAG TPA: hypothetical protein VH760_04280 [Gaiellaceae bacterium]|jgi:hypothetical protein
MRDVAPRTRDRPSAEELAERSLRRLARGGTWQGLANEIAWKAMQATAADSSCLEWLPELVEAVLSDRAEGLEFTLDREQLSARKEHLREWPHDVPGAETAAALAADEEAAARAGLAYVDVLDWAIGLLEARLAQAPPARRPRLRLLRPRAEPEPRLPPLVEQSVAGGRPRYGWPSRGDRSRPRAA